MSSRVRYLAQSLRPGFSSIVAAIAQGRVIFDNIRKFVIYLISCNVSEIARVALASAASAPLPLLPLQILFLNLVTDVFPIFSKILDLVTPTGAGWVLILGMSLFPLLAGQIFKRTMKM